MKLRVTSQKASCRTKKKDKKYLPFLNLEELLPSAFVCLSFHVLYFLIFIVVNTVHALSLSLFAQSQDTSKLLFVPVKLFARLGVIQ
jgi:hypothetical protein